MQQPFQVGQQVKKLKQGGGDTALEATVYKVTNIWRESSQSGWCMTVKLDACPHCKRGEKVIEGYDSDWFRPAPSGAQESGE